MELKDFIAGTLVQIVEGVHAAQKQVVELGGNVNPYYRKETPGFGTNYKPSEVQNVSFDVAITAQENSASKGGGGVVVVGIALGKRNESSDSSTSVSRVAFTVPLGLPTGLNSADAKQR